MLKSVLNKLIECLNTYNEYVMQGPPSVANHYLQKCDLLIECLRDAGYVFQIAAKTVVITDGLYRGNTVRIFTCIGLSAPDLSSDDIEAFRTVGFQWLWEDGVMKYEFEKNRRERVVV